MAKRSFGTVRRLPSGRWQARFRNASTGRLVAAPATFVTKGDAARWLAATQTDMARGVAVRPERYEVTVAEYCNHWLEHRPLRPRTVELYRGLLDRHILPTLGAEMLQQLAPVSVRQWHAGLQKASRPGPVTVAKAYRLLNTVMNSAVEDELLVRNPCRIRGAAVERSVERPVLSVAEVEGLTKATEERYRAMVVLGAWCGLRLGELLALTRGDLDLLHGIVTVDKAASELKNGERVVGPPKTAAGRRRVSIPPHVLRSIRDHVDTFTDPRPSDLVFVGTMGQPVRRASFYTSWRRATQTRGLEGYRFHDLRHTGATLAAATGASTRELMARLGHASSGAALRYQHATGERDVAIARALSDLAEAQGPTNRPVNRSDAS